LPFGLAELDSCRSVAVCGFPDRPPERDRARGLGRVLDVHPVLGTGVAASECLPVEQCDLAAEPEKRVEEPGKYGVVGGAEGPLELDAALVAEPVEPQVVIVRPGTPGLVSTVRPRLCNARRPGMPDILTISPSFSSSARHAGAMSRMMSGRNSAAMRTVSPSGRGVTDLIPNGRIRGRHLSLGHFPMTSRKSDSRAAWCTSAAGGMGGVPGWSSRISLSA
jgi:hypothetical protein